MARKKVKRAAKGGQKKLEALSETDGMAVEKESYEPSSLDQVWGDDGLSKYQTMDHEKYQEKIDDMSKADLKNEAIRVGLLPIDNMVQLKLRLERQFRVHIGGYKKPFKTYTPTRASREVQKILGEGK